MTSDDIIRMAREAGGSREDPSDLLTLDILERFAELVAAAEREECIKALEANEQFYCRDTIRARGKK
jgi:hypothetical protein